MAWSIRVWGGAATNIVAQGGGNWAVGFNREPKKIAQTIGLIRSYDQETKIPEWAF